MLDLGLGGPGAGCPVERDHLQSPAGRLDDLITGLDVGRVFPTVEPPLWVAAEGR